MLVRRNLLSQEQSASVPQGRYFLYFCPGEFSLSLVSVCSNVVVNLEALYSKVLFSLGDGVYLGDVQQCPGLNACF